MSVYIGLIIVDPSIETKLRTQRNGLTGAEVRAAFQWPAIVDAVWHDHPEHGKRLIAKARTERGLLQAILLPVDETDGTWVLKTCLVQ